MLHPDQSLSIGVLGTGAFTLFSVEAFLEVDGISLAGAFDTDPGKLQIFTDKYDCQKYQTFDAMLKDPGIQLIYIATPPNMHYGHSHDALVAGKHVICEKPAALKAEEVSELIKVAEGKNLLYVVNLMQRYNPLQQKVKYLFDRAIFGKFIHGYFENYAADEALTAEHWMWDEKISGGIFIEHAVHFFDLFEGWLGPGELVASQKIRKPGHSKDYYSEAQATVKYADGLVNFYHGFTQPSRMDRQEMRFLFELGEIKLYEWVPTVMEIKGLLSREVFEELKNMFPDAEYTILERLEGKDRNFKSQFKVRNADYLIEMIIGKNAIKLDIYKNLLIDMMKDQLSWIRDRDHRQVISSENAYRSVLIAEQANMSAQLL